MGWLEQVFAAKPHIIQLIGRSRLYLACNNYTNLGGTRSSLPTSLRPLQAMLLGGRFGLIPWSGLPTLRTLCPGPASYDRC